MFFNHLTCQNPILVNTDYALTRYNLSIESVRLIKCTEHPRGLQQFPVCVNEQQKLQNLVQLKKHYLCD